MDIIISQMDIIISQIKDLKLNQLDVGVGDGVVPEAYVGFASCII